MTGGVVVVFFNAVTVEVGVVEVFCPTIKAVVGAMGVALAVVVESALTTCAFGVGGDAGVMTALLCCIQNPMPMRPATRKELTTNK